jgi:hypothetical protein
VQYPLEPEEEKRPPVVNADLTTPFMTSAEAIVVGSALLITLFVDDPNRNDILSVKIIRGLDESWIPSTPPKLHEILLDDVYINPSDLLPPEEVSNLGVSESTRRKEFEVFPCPQGLAGVTKVFLWVCLSDSNWMAPPPGHPTANPCISRSGNIDTFPIIVTCTDGL